MRVPKGALSMCLRTSRLQSLFFVVCLCAVSLRAAGFPDPIVDNKSLLGNLLKGDQTAVLAGGCFWCVEAVFRQIAGVDNEFPGTPAVMQLPRTMTWWARGRQAMSRPSKSRTTLARSHMVRSLKYFST